MDRRNNENQNLEETLMPLVPIGIGLISFLIGRLTAPNHGEIMSIILAILAHPVVFLGGVLLGYLLPTSPAILAAKVLSALNYIKSKL